MKESERKELEGLADEIIEFVVEGNIKPMAPCSYKGMTTLEMSSESKVNHPSHYNKGIETIDYIESWNMNFNTGNVIKYVTRAGHKDNKLEDLEKAQWYLQREIQNIKKDIK